MLSRYRIRRVATLTLTLVLGACAHTSTTTQSSANATAEPTGPHLRDIDIRAIAQLEQKGGNRRCVHQIDNELHVPSSKEADALQASLPSDRYLVRVASSSDANDQLVIVSTSIVPSNANVAKMVGMMTGLARTYHGTYDKWETTPIPHC